MISEKLFKYIKILKSLKTLKKNTFIFLLYD